MPGLTMKSSDGKIALLVAKVSLLTANYQLPFAWLAIPQPQGVGSKTGKKTIEEVVLVGSGRVHWKESV